MGEMLFANINDGYLEALLRGYRGGILTSTDYANLCQCESIDGPPSQLWPAGPRFAAREARPEADLPPRPPACRYRADMKMHLGSTDYGNFLQNEPSPISTTTLAEKCTVRAQRRRRQTPCPH